MKKLITLLLLVLIGTTSATYAQEKRSKTHKSQRKSQAYDDAVKAINSKTFVLEAERLLFKKGQSATVSSTTNFVQLNGEKAFVQIAFRNSTINYNGLGGITVEGRIDKVTITTDKKGNVKCSFNVLGIAISAEVTVKLIHDSDKASATITPSFNSQILSLDGKIVLI